MIRQLQKRFQLPMHQELIWLLETSHSLQRCALLLHDPYWKAWVYRMNHIFLRTGAREETWREHQRLPLRSSHKLEGAYVHRRPSVATCWRGNCHDTSMKSIRKLPVDQILWWWSGYPIDVDQVAAFQRHACRNEQTCWISALLHTHNNQEDGDEHDTRCRSASWQLQLDLTLNNHQCPQIPPPGCGRLVEKVWCRNAAKRHPPWASLSTWHYTAWHHELLARSETLW